MADNRGEAKVGLSGTDDTSLDSKLFTGSAFMLVTRLSIKSIGLVSSIILARLLVAEDFGLVAIAMAFYAFIELFGSFGLQTALIQKQTSDEKDYNTAWTFNVLFGVFTGVLMLLAAQFIADYYQEPRLLWVVSTIALVAIINGFANIGVVNFQKELNFRQELKFQLLPKVMSFVMTISLAFYLRNYWALVLGTVFSTSLTVVFSYVMHPYRPGLSWASWRSLFSFSKWIVLQNFVTFMNSRVTELILGRWLSPSATGLYSIGNEFGSIATTEISAPINKASFPVYSMLAKKKEQLGKAYLETMSLCASVSIPASLGIAIVTPYFVPVVLGPNWLEVIPLMQWIALSSLVSSLSTNNGYVFMACGMPQFNFYVGALRMAIFLPLLFLLMEKFGLEGVGLSMFLASLVIFILTKIIVCWFLRVSAFSLLLAWYRPVFAGGAMYLSLLYLQIYFAHLEPYQMLVILIATGVISFICVQGMLWWLSGNPDGVEKNAFQTLIYKYQLFKRSISRAV